MKPKELPLFRDPEARSVLKKACAEHQITMELMRDLVEVQGDFAGSGRPKGIRAEFESCFAAFIDGGTHQ